MAAQPTQRGISAAPADVQAAELPQQMVHVGGGRGNNAGGWNAGVLLRSTIVNLKVIRDGDIILSKSKCSCLFTFFFSVTAFCLLVTATADDDSGTLSAAGSLA